MPHRTKKRFIDKKKAVTFQLVHRSQKDPLAADEEAPQHVLVPVSEGVTEHEFAEETPKERELRLSKQKTYGIGFDDDYDYMQHLKEPDRETTMLVPKNPRVTFKDLPEDEFCDGEEMTEVLKDDGQSAAIKIPSVVFASKDEEDIGMLHRAIPPIGPQVDWDPEVVAAMDEDFNFEDPENLIEDDFILQAAGGDNMEEYGSDEEDFSGGIAGSWMSEEDNFNEEETRSRFTQYSMTSSVLPRNEHLTLLDDQFEKFYETYDDEKIGDLGQVEIDGAVQVHDIGQQEALKMFLGIQDNEPVIKKSDIVTQEKKGNEDSQQIAESSSSEEEEDRHDYGQMVELVKEVPKENWDCESILSTYSNIYNHPKIIKDPPKPIRLSKKTGIPLDTLPTRGLTAKQLRQLDLQNEENEGRTYTISETSNTTSVASNVRRKGETKEEKLARKQAVKDMRRERRVEKKATKVAFREEKTRQHKEHLNLQQNLSGLRIS